MRSFAFILLVLYFVSSSRTANEFEYGDPSEYKSRYGDSDNEVSNSVYNDEDMDSFKDYKFKNNHEDYEPKNHNKVYKEQFYEKQRHNHNKYEHNYDSMKHGDEFNKFNYEKHNYKYSKKNEFSKKFSNEEPRYKKKYDSDENSSDEKSYKQHKYKKQYNNSGKEYKLDKDKNNYNKEYEKHKYPKEKPEYHRQREEYRSEPPDHKKLIPMARYVIHNADWASIATISTTPGIEGFPFTNVKSMVDGTIANSTGIPYFYISPLDFTAKDLSKNSQCTVLATLEETNFCHDKKYDPEDPRCTRVMLSGKMKRVKLNTTEYEFAKKALFERHPSMANFPPDHDFFVAKLKIALIAMVDWFGGAKYLAVKDYLAYNYTQKDYIDVIKRNQDRIDLNQV